MLTFALLALSVVPYDEHEKTGKPMLVLVTAEWCPACVTMKNQILPKLGVDYTTVDYDKERKRAVSLMQGTTIPQLILFRKGKDNKRLIGARSKSQVELFLKD